jgi:shikimate dehydrogenase
VDSILEIRDGGWVLDGVAWQPSRPFYAVLGDPIAHSLSPLMQNAALMDRQVEEEYYALKITTGQLRQLKDGPLGKNLLGFNVTAPHKETVAKLCDGRTEQGRDLGMVNTVRVEDGKWMGHNTDSGGILTVFSEAWGQEALPKRAVVLGAGGSARAAVDALVRWEIAEIVVQNRSGEGRKNMEKWLLGRSLENRVKVQPLPTEPPAAPEQAEVWVCCLAGGVNAQPFLPVAAGKDPVFLLDIRYGTQRPEIDPPLGFNFSDGLPVLLMQGGLSFAWWQGPPVPWNAMRQALSDFMD